MIRRVTQLIVLTVLAALVAGPSTAASALIETTSMALSIVDKVVIAGLVVGACVLIDRASWTVLTGHRPSRIKSTPDDH